MEGGRIVFSGNYETFKKQSYYDSKLLKIQKSVSESKLPTLGGKKSSSEDSVPALTLSPTKSIEEASPLPQTKEDILALE